MRPIISKAFAVACLTASGLVSAGHQADLNQVVISGQSLALGALGTPALPAPESKNALMFEGGLGSWGWDTLIPLAEVGKETIASGFAHTLDAMLVDAPAEGRHQLGISLSARGGTPIEDLNLEGGDTYRKYWRSIFSGWWMRQLANAQNISHRVQGVFWLQGEANSGAPADDYRDKLIQLKRNYERDFTKLGQDGRVPMFSYQTSSAHVYGQPATVAKGQLEASISEDNLYLVSPVYHLPHSDPLHLTNHGYRWLGAYFAKAYKKVVVDGYNWEPLRPLFAVQANSVIYITYNVPSPPLVIDTEMVSNPGDFGFKVRDKNGLVAIDSVAIANSETIAIHLSRRLVGASTVEYAYDDALGQAAGPLTGARGNLRDSDSSLGWNDDSINARYPLHNWSVIFQVPVIN